MITQDNVVSYLRSGQRASRKGHIRSELACNDLVDDNPLTFVTIGKDPIEKSHLERATGSAACQTYQLVS